MLPVEHTPQLYAVWLILVTKLVKKFDGTQSPTAVTVSLAVKSQIGLVAVSGNSPDLILQLAPVDFDSGFLDFVLK